MNQRANEDRMTQIMTWTRDCRLGLDDIDTQHRLLFAIAAEAYEIDHPESQGPEIKYLINHIRKYVTEHFAHEEAFLDAISYPDRDRHKEAHRKIIEEINHTLTRSGNLSDLVEQIRFLMTVWIRDHILDMDKQFAVWYAASQKSTAQP
jgi:hemerythrin